MVADVQPSLAIRHTGQGAVIEVHVRADPPRALEWRLRVEASGPSGSSETAQAGRTDGRETRALGAVAVNNPGSATLQVFEAGRLVGESTERFEPRARP